VEHLATIPILRSFDEAKAREFYVDFLGFGVDFEHRFEPDLPLFMGLSLGSIKIYVSEHHGDATPGSHVVFEITGLRDYHAGLLEKRYQNARPGVGEYVGGGIHTCIADPFGNTIEFVERDPAEA